ncbi:Minor extracellular protease vpr precursor [Lysinibacillus sphaericus]|nr:Minor extracellular protease vpr precursor [Lysinibacillus sphaericus]
MGGQSPSLHREFEGETTKITGVYVMGKRKKGNQVQSKVAKVMLAAMLLPAAAFQPTQTVGAATNVNDVKEMLSKLTDEQRRSLNEIRTERGFTIQPGINTTSEQPVNVIVEFKQEPAKVQQANNPNQITLYEAEDKVEASHRKFKEAIQGKSKQKLSVDVEITHEYRDAFNGVSITLPGNQVEDLARIGEVKRVWKDDVVQLDLPDPKEYPMEPKMIDSVPQIGVDKLHDEKIEGQGIKVGVLDTGIDYNHPDLQGAYKGYTAKDGVDPSSVNPDTVKGWDFIDNDADPMEETYETWKKSGKPERDNYGNVYYTSHGTHVSGTVAGKQENDVDSAVKGVAPEVDLYNYRVLGPYGSGSTSGILAGVDKSVKDEMDVINLSLGANVNSALSPLSVAVNNAMLAGVVATVAAGNAGDGAMTIGSPGTSALAITVGASDVSQTNPTYTAGANDDAFTDVQLLAKNFSDKIEELQNQEFPVVFAGLGNATDFEGKELAGKIALIERGVIAFDDKIKNAKKAGAAAVIVYNNEEGQIPHYVGESTGYIPSFRLSKKDGEQLKAMAEAGEATFKFGELRNTKSEGDHLADFSSRGPVAQSYDIKPDVVAPGVAIYSTYPSYMNDPEGNSYDSAYARIQGTSMAAPHVAGAAALILQENPDYTPFDVKAALMNTSVDLKEEYSVYEMGAGRINAYGAVHADTSVKVLDQTESVEDGEVVTVDNETASLSFRSHYLSEDSKAIEVSRPVVIKNSSKESKKFAVDVEFLGAKDGRQDAEINGVTFAADQTVTVAANGEKTVNPVLQVPKTAAEGTYEGYVSFVNEDNLSESYQVPFAIRVTSKGIDFVELERPVITNTWEEFHTFLIPFTPVTFSFKSPMETVDIVIADGESGEPIGYVGSLYGASDILPGSELYITQGFTGVVNEFTGNPKYPISEENTYLPEGDYKFLMIAKDKEGKTYVDESVAVVDNTAPEMKFNDLKPGIIEVDDSMYTDEDGHHAVWVHTNVYDASIDYLQSKGLNYDQSANMSVYYENSAFPSGLFPIEGNGDMKFGILPEDIATKALKLRLQTVEMGTTARYDDYVFVKKGTEYATHSYDKSKVKKGDEITATLTLKNVKDMQSGKFDISFMNGFFKLKDVEPNEAFEEYADENDLDIEISKPIFKEEFRDTTATISASLEGENVKGLSGNQPFIDVTFEVISDDYYGGKSAFGFMNTSYTAVGSNTPTKIEALRHDLFDIVPSTSKLEGYISPEGLLEETGEIFYDVDLSKIGAEIYVKAPDGEKYKGAIESSGAFFIEDIPALKGDYKVVVEVPGHLNSVSTVDLSKNVDGDWRGMWSRSYPPSNYAGDVNNDGVIDIMDVMRIVGLYGKKDKAADINIDGIVDELDIRLVEKNFLRVAKDSKKKPVEKLGNKGINDLLKSIGLEPAE